MRTQTGNGSAPPTPTPLDQAGRAADRTVRAVLETQGALLEGDLLAARTAVADANEAAQASYLLLRGMGADVPGALGKLDVPLHLLDTPRSRIFLQALQYAQMAAEEVDRERGWVQDGEPCGYVEAVGDLLARVRLEVEGPNGRE